MYILLLFFFVTSCWGDFSTKNFLKKKYITITSTSGSDLIDTDIAIVVNTRELIDQKKILNCSHIRFEYEENKLLPFWLENSCFSNSTLFWLTLPRLNKSNSLNLTMYYGISDLSRIPTSGAEEKWDGKFFVLSDTSCNGGWSSFNSPKKRFLFSTSTSYKIRDSTFENMETHQHRFSGLLAQSLNPVVEQSDGCTGVQADVSASLQEHKHVFNTLSDEPFPDALPPYYTLKMCENRYLDIFKGFILSYNSVDFSKTGIQKYVNLDGKYPLIYNTAGETGGSANHYHNESSGYVIPKQPVGSYKFDNPKFIEDRPSENMVRDTHVHNNMRYQSTVCSNVPDTLETSFVYVSENVSVGIINSYPFYVFGSSTPPKGYVLTASVSKHVASGVNGNIKTYTFCNHTVDVFSHGKIDNMFRLSNCNITPVILAECASWDHMHKVSTGSTFDLSDGGLWDANDQNRVELFLNSRKKVWNTYKVHEEKTNLVCFGYDYDSPLVCSGHGICKSPDLCRCNSTSYQGDWCQYWHCYRIGNKEKEVCSGHGKCVDIDDCKCSTGYNLSSSCSYSCNNISFDDVAKVCSTHGVCYDIDSCNCTRPGNYSGKFCQDWYCFNIKNDDKKVCNKRGKCIDYDNCLCFDEWTGQDCSGKIGKPKFSKNGAILEVEYITDKDELPIDELPSDEELNFYFDCKLRVQNYEVLGSTPYCYFKMNGNRRRSSSLLSNSNSTEKTSYMYILLGENPSVTIETSLYIYDSSSKAYSRTCVSPPYPSVPTVLLRKEFDNGRCVTNGTSFLKSFSGNYRDLSFYWTVNDHKTNKLVMSSTTTYFKIDDYSDLEPGGKYVVYVKASNFLGGYGVDHILCTSPAVVYSKSSIFESGSTYGYYMFFSFLILAVLMILLSCFVFGCCCCWNCIQVDMVQDKFFGIASFCQDLKKAREVGKLREKRKTFAQINQEDIVSGNFGDMPEDEEDDYRNFSKYGPPVRGYGSYSPPSTPAANSEETSLYSSEYSPESEIDLPASEFDSTTEVDPDSPEIVSRKLSIEEGKDEEFNVIIDTNTNVSKKSGYAKVESQPSSIQKQQNTMSNDYSGDINSKGYTKVDSQPSSIVKKKKPKPKRKPKDDSSGGESSSSSAGEWGTLSTATTIRRQDSIVDIPFSKSSPLKYGKLDQVDVSKVKEKSLDQLEKMKSKSPKSTEVGRKIHVDSSSSSSSSSSSEDEVVPVVIPEVKIKVKPQQPRKEIKMEIKKEIKKPKFSPPKPPPPKKIDEVQVEPKEINSIQPEKKEVQEVVKPEPKPKPTTPIKKIPSVDKKSSGSSSSSDSDSDSEKVRKDHHTWESFVNEYDDDD